MKLGKLRTITAAARPSWTQLLGVPWATLLPARSVAASEGGLEIFPDPLTLGSLIILFVLLVAPLQFLLFRPLLRVLEQRAAGIEGARQRAARLAREAQQLAERYRQALREIRDQADQERKASVDQARRETGAAVAQARDAAQAEMDRARSEVDRAVEEARMALRDEAQELGKLVAERLLGRSLS